MNYELLPHLIEKILKPTFKLVFFEENKDVATGLNLRNYYKTQSNVEVDICQAEWEAFKGNSVYGLTEYQMELLNNLTGPPSAILLKGSVLISSSQYNSFDRFFFESLAEEHIIYIVNSNSNLNKYILCDIVAMAKVKGFDKNGISDLCKLYNENIQDFDGMSSDKKTVIHVIQSPTADEFRYRVSSIFTGCCGFKISVFIGCHVLMNDGIPTLLFKQHKMKAFEFTQWLRSIKMMHSPDICIFFECCNALQVVASCLNQGIMNAFYQFNEFNHRIGLEIPELVTLFNQYKIDHNRVNMIYDNNFNRILLQLESDDIKMQCFLKSFQHEMFSKLQENYNTIFDHSRSGVRTPFTLKASNFPVVTIHLFPLSFSSIPGIGIFSSFLNKSEWNFEDLKLMRRQFISDNAFPSLALKDKSTSLLTFPCQTKKYDSDAYPVLDCEMNDCNRQIIDSASKLIPIFLNSAVFKEISIYIENCGTSISFILPGIQNKMGVIVVALEDECEIQLHHSFEIGLVFIKASYEKFGGCPGNDSHDEIVPGCDIGYFDKGGDLDYGSIGIFAKKDNTNYLISAGHIFSKALTKETRHKACYYALSHTAKKKCKYNSVHIGTIVKCEDTICYEKKIQLDYAIIELLENISFSNIPRILEGYQIKKWDLDEFKHMDGYEYYICCKSFDSVKELKFYSTAHVFDKSTTEIGFISNKHNKAQHGDSGSPIVRYNPADEELPHVAVGIFLGACDNIFIMIQLCNIPEINKYTFAVQ